MKKTFLLTLFTLFSAVVFAAKVDSVKTYSNAMKKEIPALVVTPDNYSKVDKLPVLYLLHGHGGNYKEWLRNVPVIKALVDYHQMIVVCPDGGVDSWYWDSPVNPVYKYETYVATELVNWIDGMYKTIKDRNGRAITGLSMGGQGGMYLGIKHPEIFGGFGSMSGGVDIIPFPKNWGMSKWLGTIEDKPENWKNYSVINMLDKIKPKTQHIIIDCGVGDFFYQVNQNVHQKLLDLKIDHDYTVRPGVHNWEYWANAIKYQAQFFSDFFNQKN